MKAAFLLIVAVIICGKHGKEEWKSRTIYQVLTDRFAKSNDNDNSACKNLGNYCGGTYRGLINHLGYIKGMGFDAIWISPVIKNTPGGYHGYWAQNLYELNENFGSVDDFKEFVSKCHENGIWVMVDIVANHMGPVGTDYSSLYPFNSGDHYHSRCSINDYCSFSNQGNIEYCRLADLPDLNQDGNSWVRSQLKSWIKWLIETYDIDGIRIDTVAHVPKDFWKEFTDAAGVYSVGEVFCGDWSYTGQYIGPLDAILNYPIYFAIQQSFHSSNLKVVANTVSTMFSKYGDNTKYLGVFVDNHDNARFLYGNGFNQGLLNALIFSLFVDGIPIVYYGDEQAFGGGNDPANREQLWTNLNTDAPFYKQIALAIQVRKNNQVWNLPYRELWVDDSLYIFAKGDKVLPVMHIGGSRDQEVPLPGFSNGATYCNWLSYNDCFTVQNQKANIHMDTNQVKLYVKN